MSRNHASFVIFAAILMVMLVVLGPIALHAIDAFHAAAKAGS